MINWGIIGAGNIAHRFAKSLRSFDDCRIVAISGRTEEKLIEFSKQFKIPEIYLDHSSLLDLNSIDCVYISLPHQLHFDWIIEALKRKKAVLCEKPVVLSAKEVKVIEKISIRNHTLFMEALKSKFTPAYINAKKLIMDGTIGRLEKISVDFCNKLEASMIGQTYHTLPESRGVLYDTGVYASALLLDFLGEYKYLKDLDFKYYNDVIWDVKSKIDFSKGTGVLNVSFLEDKPKNARFKGTDGTLVLENFHRAEKFIICNNEEKHEFNYPLKKDDFYPQIKSFLECYKNHEIENPLMNLQDSYQSIKLLEDIFNIISRKII